MFIVDLVNQLLDGWILNCIFQYTLHMLLTDKAGEASASHLFDRITGYIYGHYVSINNITFQIKREHGIMIVFL
ncbi:hypothetical protein D3C77_658690 [compost metagenome]